MNRPPRQEWIVEVLREVQLRLSQGESLASICKSLGVSPSSYRRWRRMYGGRAIENAAAVASGSAAENLVFAKGPKASPDSRTPELSTEAEKLLDAANGASDPARSGLGRLSRSSDLSGGNDRHREPQGPPPQQPGHAARHQCKHTYRRLLSTPAWLLIIYLSLLVQHVLLARKYRKFTDAITPFEMETRTEHPARERVHSYVFSQILAGPEPNRITNFVMQLIVYVTFTILPLLTLLFFQITFVPYHNLWVTYSH